MRTIRKSLSIFITLLLLGNTVGSAFAALTPPALLASSNFTINGSSNTGSVAANSGQTVDFQLGIFTLTGASSESFTVTLNLPAGLSYSGSSTTFSDCPNTVVTESTATKFEFTFSGADIGGGETCSVIMDANYLTDGNGSGTSDIIYTISDSQGGIQADNGSNYQQKVNFTFTTDKTLNNAVTKDRNSNGSVDGIDLTFSNDFVNADFDTSKLSVGSLTSGSGLTASGDTTAGVLQVNFAEGALGVGTNLTPMVSMLAFTGFVAKSAFAASDGAKPILKTIMTGVETKDITSISTASMYIDDDLEFQLSESMDAATLTGSFFFTDSIGVTVGGDVSVGNSDKSLFFSPTAPLTQGGEYHAYFSSGSSATDYNALVLDPRDIVLTASGTNPNVTVGNLMNGTGAVTNTGILINNGVTYTSNTLVQLDFDADYALSMCYDTSDVGAGTGCATGWTPYVTQVLNYDLTNTGTHTVYVKFSGKANGSSKVSDVYSATTTVDQSVPDAPTASPDASEGPFAFAPDVTLTAVPDSTIEYYYGGGGPFTGGTSVTLTGVTGELTYQSRNLAGGPGNTASGTYVVDTSIPVVSLTGATVIGSGSSLVLSFSGTKPTLKGHTYDTYEVYINGTGGSAVASGTGYVSDSNIDVTLYSEDFSIEGDNTVTVLVSDGTYTGSGSVTITKDTISPQITNTGSVTPGVSSADFAGIDITDGSGVGVASVSLSYSGVTDSLTGTTTLALSGGTYEGSLSSLGSNKAYTYTITATDSIGNTVNQLAGTFQTVYDWQAQYTTIGGILTSSGIINNLTGVTNGNVNNYTGLYFEKTGFGKIVFGSGLNLTDSGTILFLQNLPSKLDMSNGHVNFDPTGSDFANYGAQLQMYFDTGSTFVLGINDPAYFVVKSSTGLVLDSTSVLSNILGACGVGEPYCTLFFDTSHFTSFDLKPFLPAVHIESNNASGSLAKTGDTITLTFTGSESLTGVMATMSGVNNNTPLTVTGNGDVWSAYGTVSSTGSITPTFAINFYDLDGNAGDVVSATTDSSQVAIDSVTPTASVIYTTTGATNQDVIVTLTGASKPITITNNSGALDYTFTANGSFTFQFVDDAGNTGSTLATVSNIDKTLPVVTEVTLIATFTNSSTPTIVISSSELADPTFSGSCTSSFGQFGAGNNSVTLDTLADGTYSDCYLTLTDAAGNASTPLLFSTFTVDTGNPTATVEYSNTGITNQDVIATLTGANETITGTLSHTFTGNTSYTFVFQDLAGNTGSTLATVSNIDKILPIVAEVTPIGSFTGSSTPTIIISSSELADPTFSGSCTSTGFGQFGAGNNSVILDTLADGTYSDCYLTLTDAAGNASTPLHFSSFIVDTTDPTGSIETPVASAYLSGTVAITATGVTDIGGSGIAKVEFYYYSIGTKIGEDTTAPYSINWNTVGIVGGDGAHNLLIRVHDNAGNIYTSNSVSVTVDNAAPTVTKIGDGSTDYSFLSLCPSVACDRGDTYGTVLTFSEELSPASKSAVEAAITAGADVAPRTYMWSTNRLRIYATGATTFANDVTVTLRDFAGNTTTGALLIDSLASSIATVSSTTYTVDNTGSTIATVPYNTSKTTFLAAVTKDEPNQTWNDSGIASIVVSGNTLVVTAQDGVTTKTYTITAANAPSGGGGGGGGYTQPLKDVCPNGDYTVSMYDNSCGVTPTSTGSTTSTGTNSTGSTTPITWVPATLSPLMAQFVTRYTDPVRGIAILRTNDTSIAARMEIIEARVLTRLNYLLGYGIITSEQYAQAISGYNKFVLYLSVFRSTGNPLAKERALDGYRTFYEIYRR